VLDAVDILGERRPLHVIGNSLGGAVALQLLSLDANRVASLVLSNGAGFGAEVAIPLRLMAIPTLGELMTRRTTRSGALLTERLLYADRTLASKERVEHAMAIARQPDPGAVTLEIARHLGTRRGIKAGWRAELTTAATLYARPTLILWGDRDRILPAHHLDAARRLIPHTQTRLFTGVGHMPQIECPDEFAASVLTFLAEAQHRVYGVGANSDADRPSDSSSLRRRVTQRRPPSATNHIGSDLDLCSED
jgi:pimeloyl-ACP methyl ester carboxylesterase